MGAVLGALRAHPMDADVQERGFYAIQCLAKATGGPDAIVAGDGVALLTAGLAAHVHTKPVQQWGSQAVRELAWMGGTAAATALVEGGAVLAMAATLRTHAEPGGDCTIARDAVSALDRLRTKGGLSAKGALEVAGVLELAKNALATHAEAAQFESLKQKVEWLEAKMVG